MKDEEKTSAAFSSSFILPPSSFGGSPQLRVAVSDAAEGEVQGVEVAGQPLGLGHVDDLLVEQLGQVLVEALAAPLAVAPAPLQLLELALDDVLPDQRGGDHDLVPRPPPLAVPPLGQPLAD